MNPSPKKELSFIVWLRVVSMASILLCHITQTHASPYVVMTSQIFNVGVNIFIIISGFLFGLLGVRRPYTKWYTKRLRRIFIPYWIFLLAHWLIRSLSGLRSSVLQWGMSAIGMQFFLFYPRGAEHTWFITAILLCYLIAPLLAEAVRRIPRRYHLHLALTILAGSPMLTFLPQAPVLLCTAFFALAFLLGAHWEEVHLWKRTAPIAIAVICCAFLLRFMARVFIDGHFFYSSIICPYTHYIAAFGTLFFFAKVFDRIPPKWVRTLSDLSFEIYLYHFMFLFPPLSMLTVTPNWITGIITALIATLLVSIAAHALGRWIDRRSPHK